jgi:hypothetical protein
MDFCRERIFPGEQIDLQEALSPFLLRAGAISEEARYAGLAIMPACRFSGRPVIWPDGERY